jgi:hypothetical protein
MWGFFLRSFLPSFLPCLKFVTVAAGASRLPGRLPGRQAGRQARPLPAGASVVLCLTASLCGAGHVGICNLTDSALLALESLTQQRALTYYRSQVCCCLPCESRRAPRHASDCRSSWDRPAIHCCCVRVRVCVGICFALCVEFVDGYSGKVCGTRVLRCLCEPVSCCTGARHGGAVREAAREGGVRLALLGLEFRHHE